jgi:hypothetical protein
VRATPRPEPIRDAEELFLVDRVQQRDNSPLDDLELHFDPVSLWVRLR